MLVVASVRRQQIINASADDVWAFVGDPTTLPEWFPVVSDAVVDGDERTITIGSGIPRPERILTNDSVLRRFQYTVSAGFFRHHLGTIDVFDLGDDRCLIAYATDAEPDVMALVIGGAAGAGLRELKRQFESGEHGDTASGRA